MQEAGRQGFFPARAAGWWGLYAEALQANSTAKINWTWIAVGYEYSTDNGRTWSTYTSGTTVTLAAIGDRVCFRAQTAGNSVTGDSNFVFSGRVAVGGSIMSLLSQTEITELPTSNSETFEGLFRDGTYGTNTSLVDASALSLPATTLTAGCYNSMFSYQRSLTAAPALPATTLAQECYRGMFGYCSSLTTAPALPATSLARQCYAEMFSGCTALTTAPALPATTANYRCYQNMFRDCTSLTAAPALPATSLGSECYNYMFQNCTSLTAAPTLPATTVEASSYANMFEGCTALVTAPALPATTLANYCYQSMFMGCTSLTAAPSLPATRCYYYGCYRMFKGCTSLVTPPAIAATTLGQYCYKEMFSGCSSLATAPTLPATSLQQDCYFEMFRDCTSLTAAPALPATSMVYDCYRGMFYGCTALTSASALPATTLASDCYHMMFAYCTSLVTPPTMAATTLASACCDTMFYNCTALTRSPALMATDTSRATNCYSWMFYGCRSLAEVTTKQTSFSNCGDWLSGVAATGTFRCPEALGDDSTIQRGASACPNGWVVDNGNYWGLTVAATQANSTVAMAVNGSAPSITLEYSVDVGETWSAFTPGVTTITLAAVGDKVCFRAGTGGNTALASGVNAYNRFAFTGSVALSGNAYSLLTQSKTTTLPSGSATYALAHIFRDNSAAIDASALKLPETSLTVNSVYQYMFYNCTGLSAAPALPATTVSYAGYANMFQGCTSLTATPALPATTLATWCYGDMFHGCTALTTVPATLPAMTLASDCYNGMFHSCTSLTVAPALPATTLASQCYRTMFQQTGLLESPVLPAETQATRCYYGMFWYCPNIHKITTKQTSFSGCRAWVDGVPATGEFVCNTDVLGDNSTIQRGIDACPTGWTVSAPVSGYWGFYVEAANPNAYSSVGMSRYGSPPSVTLEYSTDNGETWQAFEVGSTSIGLAPGERAYFRAGSAGNVRLASYDYSYNYFDFSQAVRVGGNILSLLSQTEITAIPTSDNFTFSNLFRDQTALVDASALVLPSNITGHGLQYTFQGCTSLTAAPHLPATTLADACYAYLFTNCSALASISTAQTDFGNSISACYDWVRGVASSGTFTCPSALGTSATISRGSSSCPNNWTVVNT